MKKHLSSFLTLIVIATISFANTTNAIINITQLEIAKVTPDKLLEMIRENVTILMDQNLIKNHKQANTAITTAINNLKKENPVLTKKIQRCVSIILSEEKLAKEKHAAFTELMGTIATELSILTQNQINLVENQTAQFAQKKQQSESELASIKGNIASGKITAEEAAEQAASINAELAQEEQELLQNSSYLSRLGSALASPFQWIGNTIFDEQTSNLKRAAYVAGAAAGAVALGAAAYYGASYMSQQTPATENTPLQPETPQQEESLISAISRKIQETAQYGQEKVSSFLSPKETTPSATNVPVTPPNEELLKGARERAIEKNTLHALDNMVGEQMAAQDARYIAQANNPITDEELNKLVEDQIQLREESDLGERTSDPLENPEHQANSTVTSEKLNKQIEDQIQLQEESNLGEPTPKSLENNPENQTDSNETSTSNSQSEPKKGWFW